MSIFPKIRKKSSWGARDCPQAWVAITFLSLALLAYVVYLPGLSGAFLLDDYENLKRLAYVQSPLTLSQLLSFLADGRAGDLGRPISLLTFVLQYPAWPSAPHDFKQVNLLLHLLDGCLLFLLLRKLERLAGLSRTGIASALGAGLWLLHPLLVSTTLYAVQRMTELSALFTFAGLLAYLQGRALSLSRPRAGYVWATAAILVGTACASLSKENGILLPLYALVLEATLLRALPKPKGWKWWSALVLAGPVLLMAAYFVFRFDDWILPSYQFRGYGPLERLLTEARVLMVYLWEIIAPRPQSLGVFHDDYEFSRSLLDPPQTIAAVGGLAGLVAGAFLLRRRAVVFSFAVLWFLAGHLLESTVIPLELYFEHRNYVPSAGIVFALCFYVTRMYVLASSRTVRIVVVSLGLLWSGMWVGITWNEARIWGNPVLQASSWAQERPRSARAQRWKGNVYAAFGDHAQAAAAYAYLARELQDDSGYVAWLHLGCYGSGVRLPDVEMVAARLRTMAYNHSVMGDLERIVRLREMGGCGNLARDDIIQLFNALLANPNLERQRQSLHDLLGQFYLAEKLLPQAMDNLDAAFESSRQPEIALFQTRVLAQAGLLDDAQTYLDKARRANVSSSGVRHYAIEKSIADWEKALAQAKKTAQPRR